jgi:hypothetical protein
MFISKSRFTEHISVGGIFQFRVNLIIFSDLLFYEHVKQVSESAGTYYVLWRKFDYQVLCKWLRVHLVFGHYQSHDQVKRWRHWFLLTTNKHKWGPNTNSPFYFKQTNKKVKPDPNTWRIWNLDKNWNEITQGCNLTLK